MDQKEFWEDLDKLGVEQVQQKYDLGLYGNRRKDWADAWLKKQKRITPWYETWLGKAVIALAIILIGGLFSQL